MVVGPTQRYIYNQINVKYKGKNTEVHVYELGGLYNTFKDIHYRVDYIVPKDKAIKSVTMMMKIKLIKDILQLLQMENGKIKMLMNFHSTFDQRPRVIKTTKKGL